MDVSSGVYFDGFAIHPPEMKNERRDGEPTEESNSLLIVEEDGICLTMMSVPDSTMFDGEPYLVVDTSVLRRDTDFFVGVSEEYLQVIRDGIDDEAQTALVIGCLLGHIATNILADIRSREGE